MKIALIYLNDLFYHSGTAIIVRRLFENLAPEHEVIHLFASHYRAVPEVEILKSYQDLPFNIKAYFLKKQKYLYYYEFLIAKIFCSSDTRPTGLNYAWQISNILKEEKPDCIWCVLCHMPQTLPVICFLRNWFKVYLPLHVSIYDPLELWPRTISSEYFYKYVLESATSIDTIGINLQERILNEFNKKAVILNDYIESLNLNELPQNSPCRIRVAIAGHIYSRSDMQFFLDLVSRIFDYTSVFWYGNERNHSLLSQLNIPENVEIQRKDVVDRRFLVSLIASFSFAYLSLPEEAEHFSRYSVPTKLVTYLEAGLPVVFQAPAYSEVHRMNLQFGFGINISDLQSSDEKLASICADRAIYQSGMERAYLERYRKNSVVRRFNEIISALDKKKSKNLNN